MIMDFDARANILSTEISDDWAPQIRDQWRQNIDNLHQELAAEFGQRDFASKLQNFRELGAKPFSVLAYHNIFLDQARSAFVMGAYYPALVAACTLGERILNHLVIKLRDDFKSSPHYKNVYRKDSFDNWPKMIDALADWKVLLPDVVRNFAKLNARRNESVHFRHGLDRETRAPALEAIQLLGAIIQQQFTALGGSSWFIAGTPGMSFLRRDVETLPFVRLVFIPNSYLVSSRHQMHLTSNGLLVTDEVHESARDLTDAQFALGEV
ncbi:hypothetical protein AB0B66_07885 [Catellatospora sp. NPDC049111]|uniref:hypothetical protein n=1 Tax=Catellatospora sp. NPDC049111 TaxID=3155271 RepID=UPI003402EFE6